MIRRRMCTTYTRVDIDNSFEFLLEYKDDRVKFLNKSIIDENLYYFVAGLIDSEGLISINIDRYDRYGREWVSIKIPNTVVELISWLHKRLGGYITTRFGGFNEGHKPIYIWGLNFDAAIKLLQRIELRHPEKRVRKQMILENLDDLRRAHQLLMGYNAFLEKGEARIRTKIKQMYLQRRNKQS